ncbi:unnamed protein product [Ostreobium quekettii]|uniref:Sas10 C-terminal domain-containing protein n=1 Tax=Ostreobium quekettii TaxID=121088 RepID=A0A8S1IT79_9CHLO|nr:unnamed protein product [Ostreobium quekettii]
MGTRHAALAKSSRRATLEAIGELRMADNLGRANDGDDVPVLDISDDSGPAAGSESEGDSGVDDGRSESGGASEDELVVSAMRRGDKAAEMVRKRTTGTELGSHEVLESGESSREQSGGDEGDQPSPRGGIDSLDGGDADFENSYRHAAALTADASTLESEDQAAATSMEDAPEVAAMCAELRDSLGEVRKRVAPLLKEVRAGGLCEHEGLSYLEVKHMLLLHYCMCLLFFLLMKLEGKSVKDHPVILRLVEIRAYLEKIRPLDKRLQYQIDKLLRAAKAAKTAEDAGQEVTGGAIDAADPLQYGPRPDMLIPKTIGVANGDGDKIYRAPRLNPTVMDGLDERKTEAQKLKNARLRAAGSAIVQEMAAELTGAPEELTATPAGMETEGAIRTLRKMKEKQSVEEEMMMRMPVTRVEKRRFKAHHGAGLSGRVFDNFADEVADIVEAAGKIDNRHGSNHESLGDLTAKSSRKRGRGGGDAPIKPSLLQRNSKHQSKQMRRGMRPGEKRGREGGQPGPGAGEHPYKVAKKKMGTSKHARAAKAADGQRGFTKNTHKNKGVAPHRRVDTKSHRTEQRGR